MDPITGDLAVREKVSISKKGGSLTATLKKPLREALGEVGGHLSAAALEFGSGQGIVLLSVDPDGNAAPIHVRRVSRNRFEIELQAEDDVEVDAVTAAFLRLKTDQFAKGQLRLSEPITADQWDAMMDEKIAAAEAILEEQ